MSRVYDVRLTGNYGISVSREEVDPVGAPSNTAARQPPAGCSAPPPDPQVPVRHHQPGHWQHPAPRTPPPSAGPHIPPSPPAPPPSPSSPARPSTPSAHTYTGSRSSSRRFRHASSARLPLLLQASHGAGRYRSLLPQHPHRVGSKAPSASPCRSSSSISSPTSRVPQQPVRQGGPVSPFPQLQDHRERGGETSNGRPPGVGGGQI